MAKDNKKEIKKEITPSQYFDFLKGAKDTVTLEGLKKSYDIFITLAEKYKRTGQIKSLEKLCFLADVLGKEEKLIEMGINTFIYKDTIQDYIDHVADKSVKIIELSRYMREIPDDIVEVVEKTRDIFDEFYVVFTDYTGKEERKVEKERRDKDPILFGSFRNSNNISDRFYFLGDWVDEYCDLTLDKLVAEYKEKKEIDPTRNDTLPQTAEELLELIKSYKIDTDKAPRYSISNNNISASDLGSTFDTPIPVENYKNTGEVKKTNRSFFDKVRSVFSE